MYEHWQDPKPLIVSKGEQLVVVEDTALLLQDVKLPVVVVAIAGNYRTGKSYLMNRLANKPTGFPLGDTVQSKTKGIWAWCLPHPIKNGHCLLLLDTEGLNDPEKASEKNDIQILCLSVLLSSLFVYNSIGKIDQEMMNRLYFLSQVLDSISAKEKKPKDDLKSNYEELQNYLPDFALAIRDFTLELKIDNKVVTSDEYFNSILKIRDKYKNSNLPREAIQRAFRTHHCFVFTRPVEHEDLFQELESRKESELCPKFLEQSKEFCQFVYSHCEAKRIKVEDTLMLNGKVWLSMARAYVTTLNQGAVPSIESTFETVADRTNELAVKQSMVIYDDHTKQLVFPLDSQVVSSVHQMASKQAINYFKQQVIGDKSDKYLTILHNQLADGVNKINSLNQQISRTTCITTLESIYNSTIQPKIATNSYFHSNGINAYQIDLQHIKTLYNASINKNGCMHETVLLEFLQERVAEEQHIRRLVEELANKERIRIEQERQAAEALRIQQEQTERLEAERRRREEVKRNQEETRRRAEAEHERQFQERKRRKEEELRRQEKIEAERQRQKQEAELAKLRTLRQQAEDSDSDGPCSIM